MEDNTRHEHHEHLIKELSEQLEPLFQNSPQAIYLYLDDTHKTCNQKFADLLGYSSIQEWIENPYAVDDVDSEDKEKVIKAYMEASENFQAATLPVTLTKKDGQKIKTTLIMAPLTYRDEVFVLHFITKF